MQNYMLIDQSPFDNYPIEIFEKISFYLTSRQKGICQLVCRAWRNLFMPCQFRHIQIQGKRQFDQFYQALKSSLVVGHYIKRLSIEDVTLSTQELESLPFLCPNLAAFSYNGGTPSFSNVFSKWKQLRRLTELQDLTVTNHLLSALTHLSIRFTHQHQSNLFTDLHTAKNLISLSLDSTTLSLDKVEHIHQSCPYLQKLTLINTTLDPISYTLEGKRDVSSYPIRPAKMMTSFRYLNGGNLYDKYEWFYYISAKYTNLETLELWCAYSVYAPQRLIRSGMHERYGALASIGLSCCFLKSLKVLNVPMNHWLFEAMGHVGAQLDHLSISDMTDNTIDLLQHLGESRLNVASLELWGWPSLCIQDTLEETLAMISRCSNRLTSLSLSMEFSGIKNSPIPLDLVLTRCTHLTYLKLDSTQPSFGSYTDYTSNLTHFVVENGCFRNELFTYLAKQCPRLKSLGLHSCALVSTPGPSSSSKLNIHFPLHDLHRVVIDHVRLTSSYHHTNPSSDILLYNVSTHQQRRLYKLTDYELYSPTLSFNYEQKNRETMRATRYIRQGDIDSSDSCVSIHCRTLQELSIGNCKIE